MAVLNYSSQYSVISPYLSATIGSQDWLKILVSPDAGGGGHLITHGIDFGATYANGLRGLVPANTGTLATTFLRGDGWSALWTQLIEDSYTNATDKENYLASTLVSAKDIKQWIALSFAANDAMRFKGIISIDGNGNITSTPNANGFPTSCEIGDTYKVNGDSVGASSYIAGEPVSSGDMIVCIKAGSGADLNDPQYWTIVQDNVEHLITYTLNGTAFRLYAQTANNITIYAPTSAGTTGQVLISKGTNNAPDWVNATTLVVAEAAKVTYALVKGSGISMKNQGSEELSYDGSKTITIALNPATTSTIGGVVIDNGTNSEKYNAAGNTAHTPYPTITVDSNGQIYLTKTNIVNALGYDPISAIPIFSDTVDGLVPKASTANKQTSNTDNVALATTFLLGADAKWYKLPASAFLGTWRPINVNGTQLLDGTVQNGKPLDLIAGSHITLTAGTGNNLGKVTIDSAWRDVQVRLVQNGTPQTNVSSIGDNSPLVFDNSESIFTMATNETVGGTTKTIVKSYLVWYNMDTEEYELV